MGSESFRVFLDELGLNLVRTEQIRTPLLIIGAGNDTHLPKHGTSYCSPLPHGHKIFPVMTHDVILEAGWEQVAEAILN